MTIKQIERSVAELTRRVQKLHNGDWVALLYSSGSWTASTCFTGIRSGPHQTPEDALEKFTKELRRVEGAKRAA